MDPRTRKSPARFLAPLALIVFAVALYAVVSGAGDSGAKDSGSKSPATTTQKKSGSTTKTSAKSAKPRKRKPKTYTIQPGDSLGSVAEKTGVPLSRIQELNPDVDSNLLTTGQKIKLSE